VPTRDLGRKGGGRQTPVSRLPRTLRGGLPLLLQDVQSLHRREPSTVPTDDAGRGRATRSETGPSRSPSAVGDGVVDAGGSGERLGGGQPAAIGRVFLEALHSLSPRPRLATPYTAACVLPFRPRAACRAARDSCGSSPLPLRGGCPKRAPQCHKPSASGPVSTPYVPFCARLRSTGGRCYVRGLWARQAEHREDGG
jgi:hypothetical protein